MIGLVNSNILITIGSGIVLLIVISLVYFGIYYHAGEKALKALEGNDKVNVMKTDGGYFFDGPSEDKAIIIYPGAKVEAEAYAPLALKLADAGIDSFLADMPFNFAIMGSNAADKFIGVYDYDTWIMAGHSMGGIVASQYAQKHADTVDGIVLLASYPTVQIGDSLGLCSLYGSEDGCLDIEQYEQNRCNMPENSLEYVIEGGNYAQFGDYGVQEGDGTAYITDEEQQNTAVRIILEYFMKQ